MPVNFIQGKKKQKYLMVAFVIIFIVGGFILWFEYFNKGVAPLSPILGPTMTEIKIDFKVLENPFLEESQPFEKIPEFTGEKGRTNPFIPY